MADPEYTGAYVNAKQTLALINVDILVDAVLWCGEE
jgi:hypothetical protein